MMKSFTLAALFLHPLFPHQYVAASAVDGDASLEERGDTNCRSISDVVDALNRVENPAELCAHFNHKPQVTTVFTTTTATR